MLSERSLPTSTAPAPLVALRVSCATPHRVLYCDVPQGDKRFAEVMGLMGADVQWSPYSITITGALCGRRL
jgi:hypothetical protein